MSAIRSAVAVLLALVVLALACGAAATDVCPPSTRPVIVLTARVKPPDQIVADALRDHLRTQLGDRGIDLCAGSAGTRTPIAQVLLVVDRPEGGRVTALVRIGDAITDKRVERTMDLTGMPPDARALAVSSSADELLRATWAELLISDAPEPKMEPPGEVMTSVVDSIELPEREPALSAFQLGLIGSASLSAEMTSVGPELWGAYFLHDHVGAVLRLQLGFTPAKDSDNGRVRASNQGVHAGLALAFNSIAEPVGLGLDVGAGMRRVAFTASANQGAVEDSTTDWSSELAGGPRGWIRAGPVRFTLGAELVHALRPTAARDSGQVVLDNAGFGGRVSLGVLLHWSGAPSRARESSASARSVSQSDALVRP